MYKLTAENGLCPVEPGLIVSLDVHHVLLFLKQAWPAKVSRRLAELFWGVHTDIIGRSTASPGLAINDQ